MSTLKELYQQHGVPFTCRKDSWGAGDAGVEIFQVLNGSRYIGTHSPNASVKAYVDGADDWIFVPPEPLRKSFEILAPRLRYNVQIPIREFRGMKVRVTLEEIKE